MFAKRSKNRVESELFKQSIEKWRILPRVQNLTNEVVTNSNRSHLFILVSKESDDIKMVLCEVRNAINEG
ncbi:hypothetical protein M9Y10_003185 [Tritrichomonas musculus]|uniref:Uncharacterized protein n=1 Tax=Tritrichomonas musculus TaxID=1915356 RepID=A0ABR2JNU4_9EUKA